MTKGFTVPHIPLPEMTPTCEYAGDDFERACRVAKRTGARIWEHFDHKGYFIVLTEDQLHKSHRYILWDPEHWSFY